MRCQINCLLVTLCAFLSCSNIFAYLRLLDSPEKIQCVYNKPGKIVLFLGGVDKTVLVSSNFGDTWKRIKKTDIKDKLTPIPENGPIRYILSARKGVLLCSKDAGKTWIDIYPWFFLGQERKKEVNAEKNRYINKYDNLLPVKNTYGWFVTYLSSALFLIILSGFIIKKLDMKIIATLLMSAILYAIVCYAISSYVHERFDYLIYKQWDVRLMHREGILVPCWNAGVLFNILSNPFLAPVLCIFIYPLTPVFGETYSSISNKKLKLIWSYCPALLGVFIIFIIYTLLTGFYCDNGYI